MESWAGRKRPWEDDSTTSLQPKRRGSIDAAARTSLSPLPPQAGYYSRDSQILNQRRLPPLQTSSSTPSATLLASSLARSCPEAPPIALFEEIRPRSQSLFDIFHDQNSSTQAGAGIPTIEAGTPESGHQSTTSGAELRRSVYGTDLAAHASRSVNCCHPSCEGQSCSSIRALIHKVVAEVILLDSKVRTITKSEHQSAHRAGIEGFDSRKALQHALDIVQWTSLNLQEHLDHDTIQSSERLDYAEALPNMRRTQKLLEERGEQSPPTRPYQQLHHSYYVNANTNLDDTRRHAYPAEASSVGNSPHQTASSSGSAFLPPQSPLQAPQPMRGAILPSPASLNFPSAPNLPSMSPPANPSAQGAHLQDLQHQISVKTLAFQTLQREYDSLLQKLERQRTKCATLEKKFEVSDVEINSLTDEKEKLQAQVATLEAQVEDLQQSRDEARKQLVANGAQYMRIMEMANRLQAQGAEDKKKWEAEKTKLEQRIRLLEEAMVVGTEQTAAATDRSTASQALIPATAQHIGPTGSSQTETIILLRAEVGRLRTRTQTLETALHTMRRESISIQAAARQLVESGGKLESVAQDTISNDG